MSDQHGYRMLEAGEMIQEGDECKLVGLANEWDLSFAIGTDVEAVDVGFYRRPITTRITPTPLTFPVIDATTYAA